MQIAASYGKGLEQSRLDLPRVREGATHVYHLFVVRSPQRDRLQQHLSDMDIGTSIHYPVPVHLQPAYQGCLPGRESLPVTELVSREVLSLPMYPELSESETGKVIEAIKRFEGK